MTNYEYARARIQEIEVRLSWIEKERNALLHEREQLVASLPYPKKLANSR